MDHVPVLEIFTVLIMLMAAYAHMREGIFGSALMLVNVFFSGLLALNFWEPLARGLTWLTEGALESYSDVICLMLLFASFLGALRFLTTRLAWSEPSFHPVARQVGGAGFGLITGYLVSGFLICTFQTLPWHERFLWYDTESGVGLGAPDRLWLAMMHRAGGEVFDYAADEEQWFDADGSFIPRYARYRRYGDKREQLTNQGEFPEVLETRKRSIHTEKPP